MTSLLLAIFLQAAPAVPRTVYLCTKPTPEMPCRSYRRGKPTRSSKAKTDFLKCVTGSRKSVPGFYIEHLVPLHCGGSDRPRNMALVPISMWDWKRRWEIKDCEQTRAFMLGLGVGEACYVKP